MPIAIIAIGGNALAPPDRKASVEAEFANARTVCAQVADVVARGYDVVLCPGNGPQIGSILLRVERTARELSFLPLDVLGANSQGAIGYMLQQALSNALHARGLPKCVVTLVMQVEVAADDPAFTNPTKPIGPVYNEEMARRRMGALGWSMIEDAGRGWRRLVASPRPRAILEIDAVRALLERGVVPVATGGGGVPVVMRSEGVYEGVQAVIDKDRTSALLAGALNAEVLVISTGVDAVQVRFGKPDAEVLHRVDTATLRTHQAAGEFPPGSMGPKVEAALSFVEGAPGRRAVITNLSNLAAAVDGAVGTQVCS